MRKRVWLAVSLGILLSCTAEPIGLEEQGGSGIKPASSLPQASIIQDGRTGGNADFYFLFPIVPERPPRDRPFDAGAAPTVTICRLVNGVCAETVAEFPYSDKPGLGLKTTRTWSKFEFYLATWWTPVNKAGNRYRATVKAYGLELGFVDIQLVRRLTDLRTVPSDVVGVLAGLPLPVPFRIERTGFERVVAAVQTAEFATSSLFLLTSRGMSPPVFGERTEVPVSTTAPQLVAVVNADTQVVGYTLASTEEGRATVIPAGARSTALAVLYIVPGIGSDNPAEFKPILESIENLPCFPRLLGAISSAMRDGTLEASLNGALSEIARTCIADYFTAGSLIKSAAFSSGVNGLTVTTSGAPGLEMSVLENSAWRCVQVDRRDRPFGGAGVPLIRVADAMMGGQPLTWGGLFSGTVNQPTKIQDNSFSPSIEPQAEYWISGPGLRPSPPIPEDLAAPPHEAVGCSLWHYIVSPVIDVLLGLPKDAGKAATIWTLIKGAINVDAYFRADPANSAEVARVSWDLAIAVLKEAIKHPSALGISPASAKFVSALLKGGTLGFGVGNAIGFVHSLANTSGYSSLSVPRTILLGEVGGVITSPQVGPLAGVTVRAVQEASVVTGFSSANGTFALHGVPAGPTVISLSGVPADCTGPASRQIEVLPNASLQVAFGFTCTATEPVKDLHYLLDGGLSDVNGVASAIAFGSPLFTTDRQNQPGRALRFDGLDDSLSIPAFVTNGLTQGTVTFWLMLDDASAQYNMFAKTIAPRGQNGAYPFRAQFGSPAIGAAIDRWYFQVQNEVESGGSSLEYTPAANYGVTNWHKYTFTWSPSSKRIYLDGSHVAAFTGNYGPLPSVGNLIFSPQSQPRNEMLKGALDDIRIYRTERTAQQIADEYQNEKPPTGGQGSISSCGVANALFADDFGTATIGGQWSILGGSWSQASGLLRSDWDIGLAQTDQGNLLLNPSVYPASSWQMETPVGANTPVGKLTFYNSAGNKYNFNYGKTQSLVNVELRRNSATYVNVLTITNPPFRNGQTDLFQVRKTGNVFDVYINGGRIGGFIDAAFNGVGRLGISVYGTSFYDSFAVCQ